MTLLKFIYYVPYVSSLFPFYFWVASILGLPRWRSGKESTCQCRRREGCRFDRWVRKIPWRRKWQPTAVFLSGKSHGQRSLAGYSQSMGGRKESDTTERLTFLLSADICLPQSHWPVSPSAWHALPPDSLHLYPFTAFIFCWNIIFSEWFFLTCLSKIGISNIFSLITLLHFSMSSTLSRWDEGLFFSTPLCP